MTAAAAWRTRSACLGLAPTEPGEPHWWYPERGEAGDNHGRLAKAVCAGCPVRLPCLLAAVLLPEPTGIHGGAGEMRRRTVRAQLDEGTAVAVRLAMGGRPQREEMEQAVPLAPPAVAAILRGVLDGRDLTETRGVELDGVVAAAPALAAVLAAHWADLEHRVTPAQRVLLSANGAGAVHGRRSTQAKGCTDGPGGGTCPQCQMAAAWDNQDRGAGSRGRARRSVMPGRAEAA